jgi:hypothetical protein
VSRSPAYAPYGSLRPVRPCLSADRSANAISAAFANAGSAHGATAEPHSTV